MVESRNQTSYPDPLPCYLHLGKTQDNMGFHLLPCTSSYDINGSIEMLLSKKERVPGPAGLWLERVIGATLLHEALVNPNTPLDVHSVVQEEL